ncbi:MAG TPA: hypothetical protein PKM73_00445 [Verrucomicrobiota bacterium]|nr:hypothetical protein [Verrucomicrobiota bacterium]HNU49511.1 hypothetical protein [Verrucomicrobiota bacterium]
MHRIPGIAAAILLAHAAHAAEGQIDPAQALERTCFQTSQPYSDAINLRSDVAIVYGIDPGLPGRIRTWRDRGYRIHVMTGVSWGNYQDYLYGRFDGVNHEDEAQTDRAGNKISHGGDVYYMCPAANFGAYLSTGVQRALDAGAEAVHLEEPEFWVRAGYSAGFRREWRAFYGEDWQPPHGSVDAQWRASKLKYHLYRRALEEVFRHVQTENQRTGRNVRCYVPTHSLLNYAHWRIVSPESSLARLTGCDGYIAQVWTGTARTPNQYRGRLAERTFETAFLEYGAMQNLVRATGRTIWYLNDPVEDNPNHDWEDYRRNWESTLVASLLQPEVWQYEVAPWPERVFGGRYPSPGKPDQREGIPPAYATELQTVFHALHRLPHTRAAWDESSPRVGLLVSDSLMFQRGDPAPGDPHLGHVYGLALPLLKRGIPLDPVQLENAPLPKALDPYKVLLLSYHGQKPLAPDIHTALAAWVRHGGTLVFIDDDSDPYNTVRDWWNDHGQTRRIPRQHLFELLDPEPLEPGLARIGHGRLFWENTAPTAFATRADGDQHLLRILKAATAGTHIRWPERNHLLLRRGPFIIAAGLDESTADPARILTGRLVSLFDPQLRFQTRVPLEPGSRHFLLDLDQVPGRGPAILASACQALPLDAPSPSRLHCQIEGIANTPGILLARAPRPPRAVSLAGQPIADWTHDPKTRLLWIRFANTARPRQLLVQF